MARAGVFGPAEAWPSRDLIAVSEEFDIDLVLEAYRAGVYPTPLRHEPYRGLMCWWSPVRRAVLPLDALRVTRSLRKSARHYRTSIDTAFDAVLRGCADPSRPHGWIDQPIVEVYTELWRRGIAHSVETWTPDGRLAGGLYGVSLGGLFAGESMFHDPAIGRDASKVALVALVDFLSADGVDRIVDVQWQTPHLASLGAIEIDREEYLALVDEALELPEPPWPARPSAPGRPSATPRPSAPAGR